MNITTAGQVFFKNAGNGAAHAPPAADVYAYFEPCDQGARGGMIAERDDIDIVIETVCCVVVVFPRETERLSSSQHVHVVPFTNKYKDTATKDDDKTTDTDDDNISTNTTVQIPNNQLPYSCTYTCRVRSCVDFEIALLSDSRI